MVIYLASARVRSTLFQRCPQVNKMTIGYDMPRGWALEVLGRNGQFLLPLFLAMHPSKRRGEPWYSCVCRITMYHPAPPKTYLQIHTVEYAAEALSHDMLSPNRVAKSAKVVEIVFSIVPTSTHFNYIFWRTPAVKPFCVVGPT